MSTAQAKLRRASETPRKERRRPVGTVGSLSWLKSLLARPVTLERRQGKLHVVLVDRRKQRPNDVALLIGQLDSELRTLLLTGDTAALAALVDVRDVLGTKGWVGVSDLPSRAIAKAIAQGDALLRVRATPGVEQLVERLRLIFVASDLREQRAAKTAQAAKADDEVLISEATAEDFKALEAAWADVLKKDVVSDDPPRTEDASR